MELINNPDIDGGTIDGAIIGGATPAAVTGTAIIGTSEFLHIFNKAFDDSLSSNI